ncbi:MAG: GDSL-type esterase/lipase family protein [Gammaproteobacteria bacterium]|nr:hypothetical protein [Pseudomonadales bacterium]
MAEQTAEASSKPRPTLTSKLVTLLVTLLLMFLVAEGVVRLMFRDSVPLFPRYHTKAQYGEYTLRTIRRNSDFYHTSIDGKWRFQTNSQGFRNIQDFSYEKPEGVVRIVSLGDSHTQGYEVHQDYTFSAVLEKYLARQGIEAEVINTGVSGFSNAEELLLLQHEMVKYQPDFVLLGFYLNDYQDNLSSAFFELDANNELVATGKLEHTPGVFIQDVIYAIPGIQWLSENSYFYSMLFNSVWELAKSILINRSAEVVNEFAVATDYDYSPYELRLAELLIRRMNEVARSNGAEFILLDLPGFYTETGLINPSIHKDLLPRIRNDADYFVSSEILAPYDGVARIHAPNGLRHISEFTHTIYGVEVGKYILSSLELARNSKD